MTTSRNGLVKFLGSDLGGMPEPPEGVHDLLEEWRRVSTVDRIQYRIITREVGSATMKRLTPRGLKNGQFLEVRVNPDCGGNDNCWLVSVVFEKESANELETRLRTGAELVNARRPERHTPTPAAPVAPPRDPYATLGLAELRSRRQEFVEKRDASEKNRTMLLGLKQNHETQEKQRLENIATLETNLQRERNELACLREHMKEADRSISTDGQAITQINRELEKINTAIETKVRAEAREIANPLRAMMIEEAARRGISVEEIMRELSTQPPTT